jgi:CHAT domain-containing protein/predicted negative regulator of RcsB-dependent stress response
MCSPIGRKTLVVVAALAAAPTACGTRTAPRPSPPLTGRAAPVASLEERLAAGRALLAARDLPAALATFDEVSERARQAGDRRAEAVALRLKGMVRVRQFDFEAAVSEYRKSAEVAEASGDRLELGRALQSTGAAYRALNEFERAVTDLERAAKVFEALGDQGRLAEVLSSMGTVHAMQGDYARALACFNRALPLIESADTKVQRLILLSDIGVVLGLQGDHSVALQYFERVTTLAEDMGNAPALAQSLTNTGELYRLTGDYARALTHLQRALDLVETNHRRMIAPMILGTMGAVHMAEGRLDEAQAHYERGLQVLEGPLREFEKSRKSELLREFAKLWLARGDGLRAVETAEQAARLAAEVDSLEDLWQAFTVAGRAYAAQGRLTEARRAFERAVAAIETLQQNVAGGVELKQRAFENKLGPYHGLLELELAAGNAAAAFQHAERAKGRVLLDVLQGGRVRPRKSSSPEQDERERRLSTALASLNARIVAADASAQPDAARLAELRAERDQLRAERESLLAVLYLARPEARAWRGDMAAAGVDEAAAMLGPDAAALEFVATDAPMHVFLLTRDGRGATRVRHRVLAASRQDLGEKVQAFRRQLASRDPAFRPAARQLFDALLGPLAHELRDRRRLVIVPDGPLWELPFQALLNERGRYLLEDHAIQYAPSLTVLGQMTARRPGASSLRLLAVGNPTLPGPSTTAGHPALRDATLTPLPEAEREAKALAALYRSRDGADLRVGAEAEEPRIKAAASRYGVLHFATHGILDDRRPMYSHLLLAAPPQAEGEAGGPDDGILEAREILDLDLSARLVVLSACEMARGRYGPGEGMIGMSWALFVAGSPAAVLAQWKVDSASTTRLMIDFHRGLLGRGGPPGLSKSEALRRAALGLMRSPRYRHPFHWAGFVLLGDDSPLSW